METSVIEAIAVVASIAIAAPFVVGFWVRSVQTIFSTRSQETASEAVDDGKQA